MTIHLSLCLSFCLFVSLSFLCLSASFLSLSLSLSVLISYLYAGYAHVIVNLVCVWLGQVVYDCAGNRFSPVGLLLGSLHVEPDF